MKDQDRKLACSRALDRIKCPKRIHLVTPSSYDQGFGELARVESACNLLKSLCYFYFSYLGDSILTMM